MKARLWLCFTDITRCSVIYYRSSDGRCPRCGEPGELAVLPIRPARP